MSAERISVPNDVIILENRDGEIFVVGSNIDRDLFLDAIFTIKQHIVEGVEIPQHYYRRTTCPDPLLTEKGLLHLHVGYGIDDDVLLIAKQTPEAVYFGCLVRHEEAFSKPVGARVNRVIGTAMAEAELATRAAKNAVTAAADQGDE